MVILNRLSFVFQVYFSPNQSYEDRHYHETTPYEVSPPAVPAQRHKQLPEIPTKKAPYMDYYSNSYYNEQVSSTKKILPQIPQSRIKQSPSLPQTYQKIQRRASIDQRSSSLDHKDEDDYGYDNVLRIRPDAMVKGGEYEDYDDGNSYYNDSMNLQQEKPYAQNCSVGMTNNEYDGQRETVGEKKEESEGFNRRDTFMKFYQKTVKHLENPRSFFQQHTDSGESQEEHKEVIYVNVISYLMS